MEILPNKKLKHFFYWVFIILFFTIFPVTYGSDFMSALINNLIYIPVDILFTYLLIYYVIPKFLFEGKYILFSVSLALLYLVCFALSMIIEVVSSLPNINLISIQIPYKFLNTILILTFVGGIASFYKIINYNQKIKADSQHIEKQYLQSELNLLRSQINPHFLFNTLNNIDEMIYLDRDKASRYIFLLSNIMRYMLSEANKEISFLKDEIEYIKNYLELSEFSMFRKEFVNLTVNGSINHQNVPTLVFIPIVENAIKHCEKNMEGTGINIRFDILESGIILESENTIKPRQNDSQNHGFGLNNLRKRLDLIYKNDYKLESQNVDNKFVVKLEIAFL